MVADWEATACSGGHALVPPKKGTATYCPNCTQGPYNSHQETHQIRPASISKPLQCIPQSQPRITEHLAIPIYTYRHTDYTDTMTDDQPTKQKLWGGRFTGKTDPLWVLTPFPFSFLPSVVGGSDRGWS